MAPRSLGLIREMTSWPPQLFSRGRPRKKKKIEVEIHNKHRYSHFVITFANVDRFLPCNARTLRKNIRTIKQNYQTVNQAVSLSFKNQVIAFSVFDFL